MNKSQIELQKPGAVPSAPVAENRLLGADLDWCFAFESKVDTLRILNIIGSSLTEEGLKAKRDLQEWIFNNGDRYLTLKGL